MKIFFNLIKENKFIINAVKTMFLLATKLPTRKKTIVFESFFGKQYSDNPKAIYLYVKENYPEYKLYWSVNRNQKNKFKRVDLKILPRFSIKWIFIMARAEYWVTNSRLPLWLPKSKGTTYIQTWHGTPLKKLALDIEEVQIPDTDTEQYKIDFVNEVSKWDYLISPNEYSTKIFRRAFNFNKTIIESGYPRNDLLITGNNHEFIEQIKVKNNLPLDKKVILYAPTWRDNEYYEKGKYKLKIKLDFEKMKREIGNDYIVLLRFHYLVSEQLDLKGYEGFIYNMSNYEDISELYLISDILITDYSSVFFDYAVLKRPILFFVYDIQTYRDELRGFYFDFEKFAPGPLLKSTEELIEAIKTLENKNFKLPDYFSAFHEKFCSLENGRSTEKLVKEILGEPTNSK